MHKQNSKVVCNTQLSVILNKSIKITKTAKTFVERYSSDIIDDPKDIANKLNDYFVKIGPNLAIQINDDSLETFEKYLSGAGCIVVKTWST